jgi:hypothetical protein
MPAKAKASCATLYGKRKCSTAACGNVFYQHLRISDNNVESTGRNSFVPVGKVRLSLGHLKVTHKTNNLL